MTWSDTSQSVMRLKGDYGREAFFLKFLFADNENTMQIKSQKWNWFVDVWLFPSKQKFPRNIVTNFSRNLYFLWYGGDILSNPQSNSKGPLVRRSNSSFNLISIFIFSSRNVANRHSPMEDENWLVSCNSASTKRTGLGILKKDNAQGNRYPLFNFSS